MKAKPKVGMKLHKWIATGGKPKDFKGATANAVANKKKK
jgi:hypothetical protein